MKYKAKESYKKLDDSKNYCAFSSIAKHQRLMNGESVEITEVPKELEAHLESAEPKPKKEGK
jgi:hypothetical protein